MMTAALYARVSTKDKGQTTENQLRELRTFAERLGYAVHKEYAWLKVWSKSRIRRMQPVAPIASVC